ncbi:hypothetical protein DMA12_12630 [Amycolatopsis balhimycina DSM 5908]|uniref:Uncharacterized protein n=1 Tax=Amycolatopsis balhimycina DSM 5908 TaxID=1081091 RepID=A0A428WRK6_AMYBA|nr:hypothetical protein [Amycolatopsis balhimycina]RSM45727.1 hypothetical protein DMA12_12630 [Amycolatopsis balhimycina DSM 5908]
MSEQGDGLKDGEPSAAGVPEGSTCRRGIVEALSGTGRVEVDSSACLEVLSGGCSVDFLLQA